MRGLQDDWDGYGAVRISEIALAKAQGLIEGLTDPSCPLPFIAPDPDGGVAIELTTIGGNELRLEIDSTGKVEYLVQPSYGLGREGTK